MNLHQFRFVQEAVRRNLNLTETARALHTSQPGVSKAIIELGEELGVEIFARHGKRLKRVTEPGQHVLKSIELIMREVGNLRRIGEQFSAQDSGTLSIATTHTQARYVLPVPVANLREAFPKVNVSLHQGSPDQVARMVLDEVAEVGIATESLSQYDDLVTLPCYEWQHMLVMPLDHPLATREHITLEDLALEPLITYHPSFTGRTKIDQAFAAKHLHPRIALEAIDSDVIKTMCVWAWALASWLKWRSRTTVAIVTWSPCRQARCSASISPAWLSSGAPTCAILSINLPNCSATS